jgi:hypothetical protein
LHGGHQEAVKYITDLEWMVRNLSTASLSLNEITDIRRLGWDEDAFGRCCSNALRRNEGIRRRISVAMAMVSDCGRMMKNEEKI